jgi:hypothetical protein
MRRSCASAARQLLVLEAAGLARTEHIERRGIADHEAERGDAFAVAATCAQEHIAATGEHHFFPVATKHGGGKTRGDQAHAGCASRPRAVLAFDADSGAVRAEGFGGRSRDRDHFVETARIDEIEHRLAHALAELRGKRARALQPVAFGAQCGVVAGDLFDDVALQIAHIVIGETFGQEQREQFAVAHQPRAIGADIGFHRFGSRFGRRA